MKVLIKVLIGVCAVGGFLYWLLSVVLRPGQKMKEKLEKSKADSQDGTSGNHPA